MYVMLLDHMKGSKLVVLRMMMIPMIMTSDQ